MPSCHAYLKELRAALVENGALKAAGDGYTFTQYCVFASRSTAAVVVLERSANERIEWKAKDDRTLKQLEEAEAPA